MSNAQLYSVVSRAGTDDSACKREGRHAETTLVAVDSTVGKGVVGRRRGAASLIARRCGSYILVGEGGLPRTFLVAAIRSPFADYGQQEVTKRSRGSHPKSLLRTERPKPVDVLVEVSALMTDNPLNRDTLSLINSC